MNRHDRLNALLELVMARDGVHIDEIISELGVSAATARRDLDALAEQQLITRTRGGAAPHPGSSDLPLRYKTARRAAEKGRIARAAAAMVHPGEVIAFNGGTTTTEVAREVATSPELAAARDQPVVVVTNAVNIANELTVRPHVRVVVTGGVARTQSFELIGPLAELILGEISIDTLFLGVDAVDPDAGAAAHNEGEASINAKLAARARRVVVVADASKLGRSAFARICGPEGIDVLLTDDSVGADLADRFDAAGIEVVRA
ncbi:DeoR/GlpR family DNA-binding transcription regulator [Georgenia sp. TF02-10]|uniref:DeoR/GlpR family DNA-binding transcription regulator n=1 Tax=Georgenia sp. TF02-10 TaxID=2917725 RepID=UPI001FA6E66B|nr:DeoR/GlpR family DNA-binding transcription regulator [Georgenia sp. TF02-10]UNX55177.1 DeoR/GlpR family DNA-binding transcription regulator [Georgenia sp. TF02-10]